MPAFDESDLPLAPAATASRLLREAAAPPARRTEIMHADYDNERVWRAVYPTFDDFALAVVNSEREQQRDNRSPEGPIFIGSEGAVLVPRPDRTLDSATRLLRERLETQADLLPAGIPKPDITTMTIRWSDRITRSYLANWRRGPAPGADVIRVNCLLQTSEDVVTDEMLAALLWHEVAHSLTPGQGHDAQFQQIEDRWRDVDRLNAELDLVVAEHSPPSADVDDSARSRRLAR